MCIHNVKKIKSTLSLHHRHCYLSLKLCLQINPLITQSTVRHLFQENFSLALEP